MNTYLKAINRKQNLHEHVAFPYSSDSKESAYNTGDLGSIPGSGRSPGERKKESEVAQSCPILCDPMDCSLLDSFIHGIFWVRILEWVAISFSRRSSRPRG